MIKSIDKVNRFAKIKMSESSSKGHQSINQKGEISFLY